MKEYNKITIYLSLLVILLLIAMIHEPIINVHFHQSEANQKNCGSNGKNRIIPQVLNLDIFDKL